MHQKTRISQAVLVALGSTMGALAVPAFAQQAPAAEPQRIEITGSSIKRINAETAQPVTVVTREEIERSGFTTAAQIIEKLTSNNGGGYNASQSFGDSARTGLSGASLRGLGYGRTLVLLNGRRMSVYAFGGTGVDLNAIPLAALERIEVLRDGASALYGSDAIGGVLNFITRKDYTGLQLNAGYEMPQRSGGKQASATLTAGFGDMATQGFNVLGMLDFQKQDAVGAIQRSFSKTGILLDKGVVKTSGNTYPANVSGIFINEETGEPEVRGIINPSLAGGCNPPKSVWLGSPTQCRYDFTADIDILPKADRQALLVRGAAQLTPDHNLFAEASFSRNKQQFAVAPTPTVTTGKPSYVYPAGGKYYPANLTDASGNPYTGDLLISWRTVDAGRRTEEVTSDQSRFVVGADGTFSGWDYKAAISRSEAKATDAYVDGYLSDSGLRAALATGNVNPWGPQDAEGQALLDSAKILEDVRRSKTSNFTIDASVSGEIATLPAGPLMVAVGVEGRKEKYNDGYLPIFASGDIVGGSGSPQPVSGSRSVKALFTEFNVPIVKSLEANLALRYDKYSDFGNTTNPKIGLRWQPMKELLLRANAGRGFRAPGLDDLYAPQGFTNAGGNYNDPFYDAKSLDANGNPNNCAVRPSVFFCDFQPTVRQGGNAALTPEKAKQWTLGAVFEPSDAVSIGVDYWNIKLEDAITFISGDDILTDWFDKQTGPTTSSSQFADQLVIDPATGNLAYVQAGYANIGELQLSGIDISVKGKLNTPLGVVRPTYEATYLLKDRSRVLTPDLTNNLGKYATSGPSIRLKQAIGATLETGEWAFNGTYFFQSGYQDYSGTRTVGKYETVDVQASYEGVKNLKLTLGVRNLFDKAPPYSDQDDYFQVGFDPTYTDVRLRTFYLRAEYKFF